MPEARRLRRALLPSSLIMRVAPFRRLPSARRCESSTYRGGIEVPHRVHDLQHGRAARVRSHHRRRAGGGREVRRQRGDGARLGDAHHRRRLGQRRRAGNPRRHDRVARQGRAPELEGTGERRRRASCCRTAATTATTAGGEDNGDAHLKNLLVHHQVVLPITEGQLDLGPWQAVFYCEFDGRRSKRLVIKVHWRSEARRTPARASARSARRSASSSAAILVGPAGSSRRATTLFDRSRAGAGTVLYRLLFAAHRADSPSGGRRCCGVSGAVRGGSAAAFGFALAAMNLCFYLGARPHSARDRGRPSSSSVPLGVALIGLPPAGRPPLGCARAAAGVVLLAGPRRRPGSRSAVAFAACGGVLLGLATSSDARRASGRALPGGRGAWRLRWSWLACGACRSCLVSSPARRRPARPARSRRSGSAVALLSSLIPSRLRARGPAAPSTGVSGS